MVATIFTCGLGLLVFWLFFSNDAKQREIDSLTKQGKSFQKLLEEMNHDNATSLEFLYEVIVDRVSAVLVGVRDDKFDFLLCAKRIPRWLDEYLDHYSSSSRVPARGKLKNYKTPRFPEDELAWEIACVFRIQNQFPERILYRNSNNAKTIVDREISTQLETIKYFTRACAHFLLDALTYEAKERIVASEVNVRFFEHLKKKWPDFSWTREDAVGFLEDDYDEE